mmetsp:Transcript_23201/g.36288  ORF Transcript_23201/g.36288 Transcript_23201/m.36288 type:complete len:349 (-) Transcript_23201:54-1100(-)
MDCKALWELGFELKLLWWQGNSRRRCRIPLKFESCVRTNDALLFVAYQCASVLENLDTNAGSTLDPSQLSGHYRLNARGNSEVLDLTRQMGAYFQAQGLNHNAGAVSTIMRKAFFGALELLLTASSPALHIIEQCMQCHMSIEGSHELHAMRQGGRIQMPRWLGGLTTPSSSSDIQIDDCRLRKIPSGTGNEGYACIPRFCRWGEITHDFFIWRFPDGVLNDLMERQDQYPHGIFDSNLCDQCTWRDADLLFRHSISFFPDAGSGVGSSWEFFLARNTSDPGLCFTLNLERVSPAESDPELKVMLEAAADALAIESTTNHRLGSEESDLYSASWQSDQADGFSPDSGY